MINALRPRAGSSIAVLGAGSVGMSGILGAVVCGCTPIIAVDVNPDRLKIAQGLGATCTINPDKADPVEQIRGQGLSTLWNV